MREILVFSFLLEYTTQKTVQVLGTSGIPIKKMVVIGQKNRVVVSVTLLCGSSEIEEHMFPGTFDSEMVSS